MLWTRGKLVTRPWAYAFTGALSLVCLIGMLTSHGVWIVAWAGLQGFAGARALVLALRYPRSAALLMMYIAHRPACSPSATMRDGAVGARLTGCGTQRTYRSPALLPPCSAR